MKTIRILTATGALGVCLTAIQAKAQETIPSVLATVDAGTAFSNPPTPTPPPPTVDTPPPPSPPPAERPVPGMVVRLAVDLPSLPSEIANMIAEFDRQREAYLQAQRERLQQFKGATAEERAKIREQFKAQRDAWMEQTLTIREDLRKKVEEIKDKVPGRRDIEDAPTLKAGNRLGIH